MHDELFSVKDQVVLVSGGSRGIGKGIAAGFAQRGARVVVTGRDEATLARTAEELSTSDNPVRGLVCDVADATAIRKLVDTVVTDLGRIDTLFNVAGVNRRKPAVEVSEEDYDFILDINLKGAFLLSQAVGKHMIARGRGSQVNIASLNTSIASGSTVGEAHATLPIHYPTPSTFFGTVDLDIGNIDNIGATTTLTAPHFAAEIAAIDLLSDMGSLVDGLDQFFARLDDAVKSQVLGLNLPVVGTGLKNAFGFIEELRVNIVSAQNV